MMIKFKAQGFTPWEHSPRSQKVSVALGCRFRRLLLGDVGFEFRQ